MTGRPRDRTHHAYIRGERASGRFARVDSRVVIFGSLFLVAAVLVVLAAAEGSPDDALATTVESSEQDGAPVVAGTGPTGDGGAVAGDDAAVAGDTAGATIPSTTTSTTTTTTTTLPLVPDDGKTSSERRLVDAFTVWDDDLQPKSIVASGDGLFFAQNMMYRHNVAIYDRSGNEVAVIPDEVDLSAFGIAGGGTAQGSPVEAAFTPDGRFVYVSNYKMFGDGYNPVADDDCDRGDWDDSFVYKIDVGRFEIVEVIPTGAVPKYLAVSPDGSRLVVSNWCGFDVSVIDTTSDSELGRVDVGRHPRGVAITSDSRFAYVTVMGEARIDVVDLQSLNVVNSIDDAAGTTPRHILLSDDDRYLYVSNHRMNSVRKIDLSVGAVDGIASTGTQTRTMALADDGESLYVVNYQDGTVSKVRTSDMEILQTVYSGVRPVGITYDPETRQVWVANYAGSLRVFNDE
ncbi:MAG: YncE family protein [Ilumatobacter sp.]|uniref:YncE family protein n=1 Tax=Ilumatobacter sp. TaxID=1967498 RepID=UPI002615D96E|nr:YncE family protein [Ilumatobacter sp.]MDJ0768768.1 YncE family protein [Ilumatobacter sp.]